MSDLLKRMAIQFGYQGREAQMLLELRDALAGDAPKQSFPATPMTAADIESALAGEQPHAKKK